MAVGDVVNGFATATTFVDFRPAVGVEVCIMSVLGQEGDVEVGLYNGATYGQQNVNSSSGNTIFCERFMINNTNYLRIYSNGQTGSYTGIQIK
jgi:hypothetical protein